MLLTFSDQLQTFLWSESPSDNLSILQTVLRAIVVYTLALTLVRLASKRFMAKASAFDVVVGFMLGSIMSRGVLGASPLLLTIIAGVVLLGMHNLFAMIAYHIDWFGPLVKGTPHLLIKDGKLQQRGMQAAHITEHDLEEAMRRQTGHTDLSRFRRAYLERNGKVSFIPYRREEEAPHVCEITVEKGVQIVRIEIGASPPPDQSP